MKDCGTEIVREKEKGWEEGIESREGEAGLVQVLPTLESGTVKLSG